MHYNSQRCWFPLCQPCWLIFSDVKGLQAMVTACASWLQVPGQQMVYMVTTSRSKRVTWSPSRGPRGSLPHPLLPRRVNTGRRWQTLLHWAPGRVDTTQDLLWKYSVLLFWKKSVQIGVSQNHKSHKSYTAVCAGQTVTDCFFAPLAKYTLCAQNTTLWFFLS